MKINLNKSNQFGLLFVAILLIFLAGLRPVGLDRDSIMYETELLTQFHTINWFSKEPTFWLIQQLNLNFFYGMSTPFFFIYAITGVFIKYLVINKISPFPFLSFIVYISFFYIIHEMTQIRAGVATAFVFWSMHDVINNKVKFFLAKIFFATMFHASAIFFVFLYFIRPSLNFKDVILYTFLPIIGIAVMYLNILNEFFLFSSSYLPGFLSYKVELYYDLANAGKMEEASPINIGNIVFIILTYFTLVYLFFHKNQGVYVRPIIILSAKWLSVGVFILFSFSFIEVFAYRMSSYLLFPLVIIIPFVFTRFKPALIPLFFFVLYMAYNIYRTIQLLSFN